ncbi:hypothetical protein BPAE_0035g00210 [Botrytis paeoniae]|uniref:Major facilitator superfamily (MFS) profile domain-containing protein n=1 Tax=Botrytis paeoniae TaxID=278948 RepID=A0A4Z1FW26_9HELO|nr:hypothetical protein BPAE_0035g00210 [Botrytis paeoniae]
MEPQAPVLTNSGPKYVGSIYQAILEEVPSFLEGWRLQALNISICLSLCLASLNFAIVGTSLVVIADDLSGFNRSSWVVTSYLLTYTGFLMSIAKLSDIFSRKLLFISVLIVFIYFSIGCGVSRSMTMLIIMRAFEGIGGGGINAMCFVVLPEMVPTSKYPLYATVLSSTFAISALLGPLIGGAVSTNGNHTSWRWIFIMNAPGGALALAFVLLGMPQNFPYHRSNKRSTLKNVFTKAKFRRIDFIGAFLLLASSILFVTALIEGGTSFSWNSALPPTALSLSGLLCLAFLLWERYLETAKRPEEGVFPWRLATDRVPMGVLLNTFLAGVVMISVIILLPQRFQIVNQVSPIGAGYCLLALSVVASIGAGIAGVFVQRLEIAPFYVILVSSCITTIGLALLCTLSSSLYVHPSTYGYQVILGLGIGGTLGSSLLMIPIIVSKQDMAVSMSAFFQARELGGALGIAICSNVLNSKIKSSLKGEVTAMQLKALLKSSQDISILPVSLQEDVRLAYAAGFSEQLKVLVGLSGCGILATFLLWENL